MKFPFLQTVVLSIVMLWSLAGIPQSAMAQTALSFNRQKLYTYLDTIHSEHKIMGSVAIDSAGGEVYHHSLGFLGTSKCDTLRANKNTRYRIGSVTKTFTAAIIFQLIEEGRLSLSTGLDKFYPDIPKADSITIAEMLHHRSGLYNITNDTSYTSWMTEKQTRKQMLDRFRSKKSQFPPGTQTSYSNTNYILLGYIIEDITGDSYAVQLKKRIIAPLGLKHTYHGNGIDANKNEAASFKYANAAWQKLPETDMSIPGGAGGIVSTPNDLAHFIRALFKGALVSQESLDKMTDIQEGLGRGLMRIPFYSLTSYGHTGGIDGFQSMLMYFPKKDVAVAFAGNGLNYSMNDAIIGILSVYFGRDFEIPSFSHATITLSPHEMKKYTGTYSSDKIPVKFNVFVEDDTLKARATGQGAFPLTASDKTTMRFEQAGISITFDALKDDKSQQFTITQHGNPVVFTRQ